jgi:hypothetical protein
MSGCFDPKDPIDRELERKADRLLEPDFSNFKKLIEDETCSSCSHYDTKTRYKPMRVNYKSVCNYNNQEVL